MGPNLTDSDGDGLPDDVELPGFTSGAYATQKFPGDNNEDTIPNYGENWTRTNPLNENTNYAGSWDGDEDWDNDGVSNLTGSVRGWLHQGNAFHYNIYNAGSKPAASVASTATWTIVPAAPDGHQLPPEQRSARRPGRHRGEIIVDGGAGPVFRP
jgi:hypothetical protein